LTVAIPKFLREHDAPATHDPIFLALDPFAEPPRVNPFICTPPRHRGGDRVKRINQPRLSIRGGFLGGSHGVLDRDPFPFADYLRPMVEYGADALSYRVTRFAAVDCKAWVFFADPNQRVAYQAAPLDIAAKRGCQRRRSGGEVSPNDCQACTDIAPAVMAYPVNRTESKLAALRVLVRGVHPAHQHASAHVAVQGEVVPIEQE